MRGEYSRRRAWTCSTSGSSPHAWGIQLHARRCRPEGRFIPTCVGNTANGTIRLLDGTVHPHMRGEYRYSGHSSYLRIGSSPHAWGIQGHKCPYQGHGRFIPTCVGNTYRPRVFPLASPVHPHMRGEYPSGPDMSVFSLVHPHMRGEYMLPVSRRAIMPGSSPHAWGIRVRAARRPQADRFIPTCVGNTRRPPAGCNRSAVHPHMRGEYL